MPSSRTPGLKPDVMYWEATSLDLMEGGRHPRTRPARLTRWRQACSSATFVENGTGARIGYIAPA